MTCWPSPWTPADDWLPARLREMVDSYYAIRGLDREGRSTSDALADLLVSA